MTERLERIKRNLADGYSYLGERGELPGVERAKDDAKWLLAEVERLRGVARRAYDAFSLSAQYTDQERFLAMKALGLALGLVDPGAQAELEAKL
ncbi:MAG: hypothetical protein ACYDD0_00905 [Candidatus Dormibacteria bacterium]